MQLLKQDELDEEGDEGTRMKENDCSSLFFVALFTHAYGIHASTSSMARRSKALDTATHVPRHVSRLGNREYTTVMQPPVITTSHLTNHFSLWRLAEEPAWRCPIPDCPVGTTPFQQATVGEGR